MSHRSNQSIAAGIPVFQRSKALEQCLKSLNEPIIDRVIVADNGHMEERASLYEHDWTFDLTVLDMKYDVGIGHCRAVIVDELEEDHLLVMDNDMTIPAINDLNALQRVLDARPDLGGVGATLVEGDRIRYGCTNLHEEDLLFGEKAIIHDVKSEPEIDWVDNKIPVIEFDKIAQAALIRSECLAEHSWDPRFPISEHLDFFLNHYHNSDWKFAITPKAVFDHHKNIDPEYRTKVRSSGRGYQEKQEEALSLYQEKWDYDRWEYGHRPFWIDSANESALESGYRAVQQYIPLKYLLPLKDTVERFA